MKKPSEYNERQIVYLKRQLEERLIDAIFEMVEGEDELELEIMVSGVTYHTLTCYYEENDEENTIDTIEVYREYIDNEDGLIYSDSIELGDLDISSLYEIYNCLALKDEE